MTLLDACREVMSDKAVTARYPAGLDSVDVLTEIRAKHAPTPSRSSPSSTWPTRCARSTESRAADGAGAKRRRRTGPVVPARSRTPTALSTPCMPSGTLAIRALTAAGIIDNLRQEIEEMRHA